jgi:predicted nucleic acid-binding protein
MILVDTSVWIDHLRTGDDTLIIQLNGGQVLIHPLVLGELACGNLLNRSELMQLLKNLPQAIVAHDDEVLFFIEQKALMGRGIGYIDAHLLAAVALDGTSRLWTRDRRLRSIAGELAIDYQAA